MSRTQVGAEGGTATCEGAGNRRRPLLPGLHAHIRVATTPVIR